MERQVIGATESTKLCIGAKTETKNKTIASVFDAESLYKYSDLLANATQQDFLMNNISDNFATEAQTA